MTTTLRNASAGAMLVVALVVAVLVAAAVVQASAIHAGKPMSPGGHPWDKGGLALVSTSQGHAYPPDPC